MSSIDINHSLLHQLYIVEERPLREVGEIIGKSTKQVWRLCKKFGIQTRDFSSHGGRYRIGAKHSQASKELIRQKATGRKLAYETRLKMGSKGDKNARWIDGRSMGSRKMNSAEHKIWKEKILKRDSYTCINCGTQERGLIADHIKPWKFFPKLRDELSNGRTLCENCHRKTTTFGWYPRKGAIKYSFIKS